MLLANAASSAAEFVHGRQAQLPDLDLVYLAKLAPAACPVSKVLVGSTGAVGGGGRHFLAARVRQSCTLRGCDSGCDGKVSGKLGADLTGQLHTHTQGHTQKARE